MHFLDFISDSPKLFIFQKESNKTNLGGIFFLIYLILVILIVAFYIHDYLEKEEFSFSYAFIEDIVSQDEEERRLNSPEYNPILNISFDLENVETTSLDDKIIIYLIITKISINLKWSPIEYYDEIGIIDKIKGKKTIFIN